MNPPLPGLSRFEAPDDWRSIEFISDLHLSEDRPATYGAWTSYLERTEADAVFMLGDLFEAWVGDDARGSGFERRCADALASAARRRWLGFMAGNRDFLVGEAILRECGVSPLPDPTLLVAWGRPVLLTHGDRLCLADDEYQRFRAVVRDAGWQREFLAKPLAERQQIARTMRDASARAKRGQTIDEWADVDARAAVQWLREAGAVEMVHGHTHRPGSGALAPGFTRHVLSDWEADGTPARAEVLRLTRAGFSRHRAA